MTWAQFHFLRKHHSLISPWVYNPFVLPARIAGAVIMQAVMPRPSWMAHVSVDGPSGRQMEGG